MYKLDFKESKFVHDTVHSICTLFCAQFEFIIKLMSCVNSAVVRNSL